eukprot:TRINITY_DN15582_c0_g1_i3.p2 TRINITY_DN15582_c0_g1~~TRINITY_DN15582_c0_g1_i3.p2  ORF type:complete len:102 (+),score=13.47 TRINITY_DN15582_c0_g1_i3:94-399(+)
MFGRRQWNSQASSTRAVIAAFGPTAGKTPKPQWSLLPPRWSRFATEHGKVSCVVHDAERAAGFTKPPTSSIPFKDANELFVDVAQNESLMSTACMHSHARL